MKVSILLVPLVLMLGCQRFQGTARLVHQCLCASDRDDAIRADRTLKRKQRSGGVIELPFKYKVVRLEKGVIVRTLRHGDGVTMVWVETGPYAGEPCWLPNQMIVWVSLRSSFLGESLDAHTPLTDIRSVIQTNSDQIPPVSYFAPNLTRSSLISP